MFAVAKSWPIIVDNANLIASANNMLIGASFAPIFAIKIDTCRLAINENEDIFLKDFAFWWLYFRAAKFYFGGIAVSKGELKTLVV